MNTFLRITGLVGAALFLMIVLILVFTLPTMWLWNWLMPDIFGLQTITFFQAMGLITLTSLLFRSSNTTKSS